MIRRNFHHAVFYGFWLCLASTTIAFGYDHVLGQPAPYPFFSVPVLTGTFGGLALLAGSAGLLYLKRRMDRAPASIDSLGMGVGFTVLLFLTSATGFLLLLLRSSAAMGVLLTVHLGCVAGLFITMPNGKFVHAVYRYGALLKNAPEQPRDPERPADA
jgi:citrate/tricarballylate utilization protein